MFKNRPITDYLAGAQASPVVSVEFFPPKNEEGGQQILKAAEKLKESLQPDFVSITYGAGGTTRERTLRYARLLKDEYQFQVMPHLTCVGASRDELKSLISTYQDEGFCNIMALRGDAPKGATSFQPHPDGLRYANELVAFIRSHFSGFCLGVAGYPETHPESPSPADDIRNLKLKCDAGGSFITTQLFFDNSAYFDFVSRCRLSGIRQPVLPGLLIALSATQVKRFCEFSKTAVPPALLAQLEACGEDESASAQIGIRWAFDQIKGLLAAGAPGFHLYILNRSGPAIELVSQLKAEGVIKR